MSIKNKILVPFVSAALGGLITAYVVKPAEIDYQTLVAKEIEAFEVLADGLVESYHPEDDDVQQPGRARSEWLAERQLHKARIKLAMYGYPKQLLAFEDYLLARSRDDPSWRAWAYCIPSQHIEEDVEIYRLWRQQIFRGSSSLLRLLGMQDDFTSVADEQRVLALLIHNCIFEPPTTVGGGSMRSG